MAKKKDKNKKLNEIKNCAHRLVDGDWDYAGSDIKISYKCEKCGCKVVEEYHFIKGYEMDENGNVISEFY